MARYSSDAACLVGAAAVALMAGAAAADAPAAAAYTRAEIKQLSGRDLAAHVLKGVAAKSTSSQELKFYVSPVVPTPPWLEQVAIDMPPHFQRGVDLCVQDRLMVGFGPVDPEARKKWLLSDHDAPTEVSWLGMQHRYADARGMVGPPPDWASPNCATLPATAYFTASNISHAAQALQAFDRFRGAAGAEARPRLTCRAEWKEEAKLCRKAIDAIAKANSFPEVVSVQQRDRVRTVEFEMGDRRRLWLTITFNAIGERPSVTLSGAEVIILAPEPVI